MRQVFEVIADPESSQRELIVTWEWVSERIFDCLQYGDRLGNLSALQLAERMLSTLLN